MRPCSIVLCVLVLLVAVPGMAAGPIDSSTWLWQTYDGFSGPGLDTTKWSISEQENVRYTVSSGLNISSISIGEPWFELEATPALSLKAGTPFAVKLPFLITNASGQLAVVGIAIGPPVNQQDINIFTGWVKGQGFGMSGQLFASGLVAGEAGPVQGQFQTVQTSTTQGQLGVTYDGTVFSGYYNDGSGWRLLYSHAPGWTGAFVLGISAQVVNQGSLALRISDVKAATLSPSSPSNYFDAAQKLYIGYYQRPADPEGLLFWARGLASVDANGDGSFDGENFMWVLEQFAFSDEARKIYGGNATSANIALVIDSIYMGLFNRHAEADGLAFWVNSFNTGASTPASILWEVMKGAQFTDKNTLDNKVTASGRLTHVLDPEFDGVSNRAYPSWANNWLKNVTYDPATIPTEDAIEGLF